MKFVILMVVIAFAAAHNPAALFQVDAEKMKNNVQQMKDFYVCYVEDPECTPEANFVKPFIADVFATSCANCHPDDKHKLAVLFKAGQEKVPTEYGKFISKYDPEGKHQAQLKKFIEEHAN